jgi:hypothetical protein
MAKGLQIIDKDMGWNALKKEMLRRKPDHVDVGVMVQNDSRSDAIGNVALALIHELGLGVPERSFVRGTIDANETKYRALVKLLAGQIVEGRLNKKQALMLLGAKVEADIKERVRAGIQPPLAPSTVAHKGSSTPLIDTGQLLSSIDYEVG